MGFLFLVCGRSLSGMSLDFHWQYLLLTGMRGNEQNGGAGYTCTVEKNDSRPMFTAPVLK